MASLARRILAPNPGPMTLDGTNTWVLQADAAGPVGIVDPGPAIDAHLDALAALPVELILVTHHHADHTEACAALHARTGAPVRGADPAQCFGGEPLRPGEELEVGGVHVTVVAAPGHTSDSIALLVPEHGPHGAVLTGDTILGRGSTVIMHPDGSVGDYLATLDRLEQHGDAEALPGHGDPLPSLGDVVRAYRAHRLERLDEVRAALAELGEDATVAEVTDAVYATVDPALRFAAEASMRAQLDHLRA